MESVVTRFEAYLLTEKRVALNTFQAYKHDLGQLIQFLREKDLTLEQVTLKDLKEFLKQLKRQNMSARSMARKISSIKHFFVWAHELLAWKNTAHELHAPKLEKRLPQFLTEHDIEKLFTSVQPDRSDIGFRNSVMLYLLYVSGMRVSELTNLRLSDIHFDTGFIHIQGKGGKGRMIPIPQTMLTLLRDYIATYHQSIRAKHEANAPDYLFPVCYGGILKPISRQSFWLILKAMCSKAGIQTHVSPHTLRHSLATHLLKKGANLRSLQLLLGHEHLSTVQMYTHVETDHLRKIYDKKHPRA